MASVAEQLKSLLEHCRLKEEDCSKKVTDKHLQKICSFCTKWRDLYPHLDMKQIDVSSAERDGNDEDEKRQRFLDRWQSKKGRDATYEKLMRGLLEIERKEEAESVCELLLATAQQQHSVANAAVPASQPESKITVPKAVDQPLQGM